MYDISATGASIRFIASRTFATGFLITEFASDQDPFDIPSIDIATAEMNINGDMVTFTAPTPTTMTLNVIPGSEADENLSVVYDANRAARNKRHVRDEITMVISYPDGSTHTFSQGKMLGGTPGKSPASAGRVKSSTYTFAFGMSSRTRARL